MVPYKYSDFENNAQPIQELAFSRYVIMLLRNSGINTVEQLMAMTDDDIRKIKRIGRKSIQEIKTKISQLR